MILIVYLGHGIFIRQQFCYSPNQFLGEVLGSSIEEPHKKNDVPSIVARV